MDYFYCDKLFRKMERCIEQCGDCIETHATKEANKRKCPLCHTLNSELVGRCICGCYIEAIDENTWKEKEWMERHNQWEDGKLGYNMIYERLKKLGYE